MKDYTGLKESFAKAGLTLEIAPKPIQGGESNKDIFQLDIPRSTKGNRRTEWFRIYPGHDDNLIAVQGMDTELKQLVLTVREPEREFTTTQKWGRRGELPKIGSSIGAGRPQPKVAAVSKTSREITITGKTPKGVRHYLCGVDERQLFICQLPKACPTVAAAHLALKRPELIRHEGKSPGRTLRQGEWFLVNLTVEELDALKAGIKAKRLAILKDRPLGSGGHPHVAEEMIQVTGSESQLNSNTATGFPIRERATFVRGKISHQDHATVVTREWRRVIRNNELGGNAAPGRPSANGVYWID